MNVGKRRETIKALTLILSDASELTKTGIIDLIYSSLHFVTEGRTVICIVLEKHGTSIRINDHAIN